MRRVQLVLSEPLDDAVSAEARRAGISRSAAVRRLLERALQAPRGAAPAAAALLGLAGIVDSHGASSAMEVDEIVYGAGPRYRAPRRRAPHRAR